MVKQYVINPCSDGDCFISEIEDGRTLQKVVPLPPIEPKPVIMSLADIEQANLRSKEALRLVTGDDKI